MKLISTGKTSSWDFRNGIFGMDKATLVNCELDDTAFAEGYGILAYLCDFEMNPAEISVYPQNQDTLSCYIIVDKVNSQYLISEFCTGL